MTAPTHYGVIAERYQLVAPIGSGGTATVYRGHDMLLDREVAVKKLTLSPTVDADARAEAVERTFREARAAARIHHPGVAAVYDIVTGEESPYLVMQLVEGRSLADEIAEYGALPARRVADIGRQLLAALVAGHVVGVLHRDLKPANVLVTPEGQAVLTDFGIAALDEEPSLTKTGVVVGTPGYVAPERANGMAATPAADLWSLGATLYAGLCGAGPFDARESGMATLYAVATEEPPRLTGDGPLCEIINALLGRDPDGRPAFAEIAQALDTAAAHGPGGDDQRSVFERAPVPERAPDLDLEPDLGRMPVLEREAALRREPVAGRGPDTRLDMEVPPSPPTAASPVAGPSARPAAPGPRATAPATASKDTMGKDNKGKISLILAAVAALAIAGSAVAAYLPHTHHAAQAASATPSPGSASAGPTGPAPALAGPPGPPPVGQQFRVAAAANTDGSPEVITRQASGALAASRFTNGAWSAWTTLPGGAVYTANPVVATAKDGRLIVFARATTGQVAEIWQASPGSATWAGPMPLGATITRSSPVVVTWPDGHLEVFALLSDAHVGYATQSAATGGGTWTGWTSLGGPVTGPPAAALDGTGHPQVFAATAGHQLMYDYYRDGTWAGWAAAPGKAQYVGVPGIAPDTDGRLEVFMRSTNGDLLHVWQTARTGTGWSGPGNLAPNGCSTDPAVFGALNGEHGGHLEAFCMDSTFNDSVYHTFQTSGSAWSPWQSLKGSSNGAITALQTTTFTGIVARTDAGAIAYQTWTAQHGWSAWAMLPNS